LPGKLLIDPDALLRQSVNDPLCRGVQAETMEGVPDRSFLVGRAYGCHYTDRLAHLPARNGAVREEDYSWVFPA
jgi:hypothetical protein